MPEIREILSLWAQLLWALIFLLLPTGNQVVALWFDSDLGKNEPSDCWHARGLVGHLVPQPDKDLPIRMGASLWPEHLTEEQLRSLKLTRVEWNSRLVLFKFEDPDGAETWMSARFYTHTSVQVYNHEQWHESVSLSRKDLRGFRIAFAIEFAKYTISFNSQDRLCQIQWAQSRGDLPGGSWPNILDDWRGYLDAIINWRRCSIQKQSHEQRTKNFIVDVIKDIPFSGIGVYTASDVLHGAGIPPYISESAVFDEPPVLARLLESQYHFVRVYYEKMFKKYVMPCMYNGVLAPNTTQRLNYARCISVHGMDTVKVTSRQKDAINAYQSSPNPQFHFFEPAKIKDYLWEPGHLGHLIFGEHHSKVAPSGWKPDRIPDPITVEFFPHTVAVSRPALHVADSSHPFKKPMQRYIDEWFTKSGAVILNVRAHISLELPANPCRAPLPRRSLSTFDTHLDLSLYTSFEVTFNTKSTKFCNIYAGRSNRKKFWSVIPVPNVFRMPRIIHGCSEEGVMKQYTQAEQATLLFRYIIKNTRLFAVGPLEYCGSGIPIKPLKGEGKGTIILTTRFEPLASSTLVARALHQRDSGNPRWKQFLQESHDILSRRENWHIKNKRTELLRVVQMIEDRVVMRIRLHQLAIIARSRNQEEVAKTRRAEEEKQFRKEQKFYEARKRQFVWFHFLEHGSLRSSRRRLIHNTWPLRQLHYEAWPALYKSPPGYAPPVPFNEPRRVPRNLISTWQNDLELVGYPSIVSETPSLTTITSLDPCESLSEPSREGFVAPYTKEDGQTTFEKFYVIRHRGKEYWSVFKSPKNPFSKNKASGSIPIKKPLRYHRNVFANAIATALHRKAPFPTVVTDSLGTHRLPPSSTPQSVGATLALSTTTSSTSSIPAPTTPTVGISGTSSEPSLAVTGKKRRYINSDTAVMASVDVVQGKRARKAPQRLP